jgi:DNA-binding MarR family transcriptional regulator
MDIQRKFERKLDLVTFAPEYELVCCLLDDEWLTPSQLHQQARVSPAALRYMIARMVAGGLVTQRQNPADSRSTQYRLTTPMRDLVLDQHRGYLDLATSARANKRQAQVPLNRYQSFIHKGRQVSHLTAEFQILLYLYVAAGLGNHEISQFIDVSLAKFNQSLGKLRSLGLVQVSPNPSDRRSKLYDLPAAVRRELDRLHEQVAHWLASNLVPAEARATTGVSKRWKYRC